MLDSTACRRTDPASCCASPPHQSLLLYAALHAGLIDAHLHLIYGGLSLSRLDLSGAASREQFVAAVAAAAAGLRPGQWLLGGAWDESRWGGQMPSAEWIDAGEVLGWQYRLVHVWCAYHVCQNALQDHACSVAEWCGMLQLLVLLPALHFTAPHPPPAAAATGDVPAWLLRHDSHMALANSAALRLADITGATPDPPGGAILRGPDGQPAGLLTDAAMQLVAGERGTRGAGRAGPFMLDRGCQAVRWHWCQALPHCCCVLQVAPAVGYGWLLPACLMFMAPPTAPAHRPHPAAQRGPAAGSAGSGGTARAKPRHHHGA